SLPHSAAPPPPHSFPTRRSYDLLQCSLLFPALSTFCQLSVRERELLGGLAGPAVFVANHVSPLDAVVMAEALPARYRHRSVVVRSEEHTSELQSRENLVCRLLLE